MNKKEILEKSRNENINEYEEKILNDSYKFSRFVLMGISIIFFIINVVYSDLKSLEKGIPSFDYAAILMSLISFQYFYKYFKMRDKNNLIKGVGFGLVCIIFIYLQLLSLGEFLWKWRMN